MFSRPFYSSLTLVVILLTILFPHSSASAEGQSTSSENSNTAIPPSSSLTVDTPKSTNKRHNRHNKKNKDLVAVSLLSKAKKARAQKNYSSALIYLKEAARIIPSLTDEKLPVRILTNLSIIQRTLGHYDESMTAIQNALMAAHKTNKTELIFSALQIKGALLQKMKRYDESVTVYLSAKLYMSGASEANRVRILRDIANAYNKIHEYESSIRYYKKTLKLIEDINNTESIPKILAEIAKTQAKIGDYAPAIENIKLSLALSRQYKNEKQLVESLVIASVIYRKVSVYEEALTYGLEAIEIYQNANNVSGVAAAANAVGLIYTHLKQNEKAKNYFTQVINLPAEKIKDKYRAAALRDLGKLALEENNKAYGLELSQEAYDIYKKIGDDKGVATVQKNLGFIYCKIGKIEEAIRSYNKAILLFQQIGDIWNEAETKAYLSNSLIDIDVEQAISLAHDSLTLAEKTGAKSVAEAAYTALITAEEKRNNYKKALFYAKKKEAIINEIKTDDINKRSAEMYIMLGVEKKERALEELKREKLFMSLALDNNEKKLNILEKEKMITDLKAQNTLIILCATLIAITLFLLKTGRVNIKVKARFIISLIIIVTLLFYSFNSNAMDIIKITQSSSPLDIRPQYTNAVLQTALDYSTEKYGSYTIEQTSRDLTTEEKMREIYKGTTMNVAMSMTSPDWEYLMLPIRIPIRRGIGSYRLLTINKDSKQNFTKKTSINELKSLTIGLQKEWVINELLEDKGFSVVKSSTYDGIFKMLNKNRFDYTPRGIHEAYDEITLREDQLNNLMIEPNLVLYIPQPYYIFVSPKFPKIAERIEYGLEKMISEGVLQKMFNEHFEAFIQKADIANRTVINLSNEYLTKKTPINRKELWVDFGLDKEQYSVYTNTAN